jgi:hypothetical protein
MADPWMAFLSSLNIMDLGSTGLLAVCVLMILTGRLNPRSVAESWRDAYLKERAAGDVMRQQISDLVSTGHVTARVLDSLPTAGGDSNGVEETTETRRRRWQS